MSWAIPPTFTNGVVVTETPLNIIRDDLRYLKGLDGVVYIESPMEIAEGATPSAATAARSKLFVGNAAPNNGVFSCIDDAGDIYQMLRRDAGTFTPTYFGSSTAGVTTYTNQVGLYERQGDVVFFQIYLNWTNATGTGNIRVGGLPVTIRNIASGFGSAAIWANNLTFASSGLQILFRPNTTQLEIWTPASGGGAAVPIDTSGDMAINGFYFA